MGISLSAWNLECVFNLNKIFICLLIHMHAHDLLQKFSQRFPVGRRIKSDRKYCEIVSTVVKIQKTAHIDLVKEETQHIFDSSFETLFCILLTLGCRDRMAFYGTCAKIEWCFAHQWYLRNDLVILLFVKKMWKIWHLLPFSMPDCWVKCTYVTLVHCSFRERVYIEIGFCDAYTMFVNVCVCVCIFFCLCSPAFCWKRA